MGRHAAHRRERVARDDFFDRRSVDSDAVTASLSTGSFTPVFGGHRRFSGPRLSLESFVGCGGVAGPPPKKPTSRRSGRDANCTRYRSPGTGDRHDNGSRREGAADMAMTLPVGNKRTTAPRVGMRGAWRTWRRSRTAWGCGLLTTGRTGRVSARRTPGGCSGGCAVSRRRTLTPRGWRSRPMCRRRCGIGQAASWRRFSGRVTAATTTKGGLEHGDDEGRVD